MFLDMLLVFEVNDTKMDEMATRSKPDKKCFIRYILFYTNVTYSVHEICKNAKQNRINRIYIFKIQVRNQSSFPVAYMDG